MANKLGQFAVVMHSSCIILSLVYILYLFFFHFSIPFRHTYMSFISGNKAHRKKRRQRENIKMHIHSWVYKMKKTIATTFLVHTAHRITNKRALLLSLMIYVHSSVVTVARSRDGGVDGVEKLAHFMHKIAFFINSRGLKPEQGSGPPHFDYWFFIALICTTGIVVIAPCHFETWSPACGHCYLDRDVLIRLRSK